MTLETIYFTNVNGTYKRITARKTQNITPRDYKTEYLYEHSLDNVHGDVTSRSEILYYRNIGKAGLVRGAGAGAAGEEQGLGDPPWSGGGDSVATAGDFRGTVGTT